MTDTNPVERHGPGWTLRERAHQDLTAREINRRLRAVGIDPRVHPLPDAYMEGFDA